MLAIGLGPMASPVEAGPSWAYYSRIVLTPGMGNTPIVSCTHVEVCDTATNTVVVTVLIRSISPRLCVKAAVAPDAKPAYIAWSKGAASVIDTASNTVVAAVEKVAGTTGAGINPPPAELIPSQRRSRSAPAPPRRQPAAPLNQ